MANTPAAGVVDSNFNAGGITPYGIYWVRDGVMNTLSFEQLMTGGGGESSLLWRPTVAADGEIRWNLSTETTPPDPQNIKGPEGPPGKDGAVGPEGPPGTDAELPAGTMGDLLHHDGTDWVATDPGTALAPNQRVGDLLVATASGGVEWMPEENAIPGIYADVAPLMADAPAGYVATKKADGYGWAPASESRFITTRLIASGAMTVTRGSSARADISISAKSTKLLVALYYYPDAPADYTKGITVPLLISDKSSTSNLFLYPAVNADEGLRMRVVKPYQQNVVQINVLNQYCYNTSGSCTLLPDTARIHYEIYVEEVTTA